MENRKSRRRDTVKKKKKPVMSQRLNRCCGSRIRRVRNEFKVSKPSIKKTGTLARWLSWLDHGPMHHKVAGSIPGQGTYLGLIDVSHINACLSVCLYKNTYKYILGWGLKKETRGNNDRIRSWFGQNDDKLGTILSNVYAVRYKRVYSSEPPINIPAKGKKLLIFYEELKLIY